MGHEGHEHDHEHDHGTRHVHPHAHAPPHAHGDEHSHDPEHLHAHAGAHARMHPHERALEAGAGKGRVLFLDAPSGLAGDMIIAALIDLGVPRAVVEDAVGALGLSGFHLHFGRRTRSGIVATAFDVHVDAAQPGRSYGQIRRLLDAAPLPPALRERAQRTFLRLAEAEAKVHRALLDDVHFHEVGAVDAIVDVVGSAAALEHLGAELVVSPLPMGRGFVKAAHGVLPLPAPAAVECLAGFETYDGGLDFEFVTPTGAAIVGANAARSARWPTMRPIAVGWGAGAAELRDRPNLLRAILADVPAAAPVGATHAVLEANLDDATGELLAGAVEALLAAGALDAWATPITMKKGRPAVTLSVLVPAERADALAHAMLRETPSLGVRRHDVSRVERPRRAGTVRTRFGEIAVKIAEGPFGPAQIKPEWDACAEAARRHGVPVKEVIAAVLAAAP
jgi:uncharacterized protein (TIGR00299 family) protein